MSKIVFAGRSAARINQARPTHVAIDHLIASQIDGVIGRKLAVDFFMRLAKGGGMMQQVISVLKYAKQVLEANLDEASPDILEEYQARIKCAGTSCFLCFHNTYTSLSQIREMGAQVPEGFLLEIIFGLLECEDSIER